MTQLTEREKAQLALEARIGELTDRYRRDLLELWSDFAAVCCPGVRASFDVEVTPHYDFAEADGHGN